MSSLLTLLHSFLNIVEYNALSRTNGKKGEKIPTLLAFV
jgi:hypothetical protein